MKIRRYGIAFGRDSFRRVAANWIPHPFRVWRFLCFYIFKEARPQDIDKKQQFPLGTPMEYEGLRYHYYKAGSDIVVGPVIPDTEASEP
ncbi:hypothetical protein ES703_53219 [subsurface metagenome]